MKQNNNVTLAKFKTFSFIYGGYSENLVSKANMFGKYNRKSFNLKWPLLEIEASGFGVPLRAASCCSRALDSKYSSHAAASYRDFKQSKEEATS